MGYDSREKKYNQYIPDIEFGNVRNQDTDGNHDGGVHDGNIKNTVFAHTRTGFAEQVLVFAEIHVIIDRYNIYDMRRQKLKNMGAYVCIGVCILVGILLLYWMIRTHSLENMDVDFTQPTAIPSNPSDKMKQYNVIFAGTCRNVEQHIGNIMDCIERCGQKFKSYQVVVYENDSTDNTRKIMLEKKKPNYHYLFENGITEPKRTVRLQNARNKIMDKVRELNVNGLYEYMILIDLDDVNGKCNFVSSIDSNFLHDTDKWDVMTANQEDVYYDIWALRKKNVLEYDTWKQLSLAKDESSKQKLNDTNNMVFNGEFIKDTLTEVDSAFGGAAIYKLSSIPDVCTYIGIHEESDLEKCEHVEFNRCIRKGGGQLFINRDFITK
jgi:hypothetical protein